MRQANDLSAKKVVIIGENELKNKTATVKDMVSGEQRETKIENLIEELRDKSQITNSK